MEISDDLDRRVRRSQGALMQAMLDLLKEQPLQDISVSAITERADVNRSTFYAHYTDKYDLFHACVRMLFEDMLDNQMPDPKEMQCETIKDLIIVICDLFGQLATTYMPPNRQLDPIIDAEVQQVLFEYLLEWMQSSEAMQGDTPEATQMLAALMSWTVVGAGIEYRYRSNGRTPEEIAAIAYNLMKQPVVPEHTTG